MAYNSRSKKVQVGIEGADEIIKILKDIGIEANAVLEEAAEEGAKIALAEAKRRVPVKTGNLRDNLEITKVKSRTPDKLKKTVFVKVGFNKKAFYGTFVELGTRFIKAKPFLRPAIDQNRNSIAQVVNNAIDKALRRGGLK